MLTLLGSLATKPGLPPSPGSLGLGVHSKRVDVSINYGVLLMGILITRALLCGVYILGPPMFGKLQSRFQGSSNNYASLDYHGSGEGQLVRLLSSTKGPL